MNKASQGRILNDTKPLLFLVCKSLGGFEYFKYSLKVYIGQRSEILSIQEFLQRNGKKHATIYITVVFQEFWIIRLVKKGIAPKGMRLNKLLLD